MFLSAISTHCYGIKTPGRRESISCNIDQVVANLGSKLIDGHIFCIVTMNRAGDHFDRIRKRRYVETHGTFDYLSTVRINLL